MSQRTAVKIGLRYNRGKMADERRLAQHGKVKQRYRLLMNGGWEKRSALMLEIERN